MPDERAEQNRRSWNAATRAHNSHKQDQAGFLARGGSTLFPEELELLGEIGGLRIAHLQCNAGQDTLSLARLGATLTGVDISDEAIEFARALSRDSGIEASFVREDAFDWLERTARTDERFDVVFVSYGAIPWISDIARWARGVASVLADGGRLVLLEFHPVAWIFDEDWKLHYDWGTGGDAHHEPAGVGDYVAASGEGLAPSGLVAGEAAFQNAEGCWEYYWSAAQLQQGMIDAGLTLSRVEEYPWANGCRAFGGMVEDPPGSRRYRPPECVPRLPLMLGLVAGKAR